MIQNEDLINEFAEKAKIHIQTVQDALSGNIDSKAINNAFIAVHSIKGTAGFFGLEKIVSLARAMESVVSKIRDNVIPLDDSLVHIILSSNNCLKSMVENVLESENTDISDLVKELDNALSK